MSSLRFSGDILLRSQPSHPAVSYSLSVAFVLLSTGNLATRLRISAFWLVCSTSFPRHSNGKKAYVLVPTINHVSRRGRWIARRRECSLCESEKCTSRRSSVDEQAAAVRSVAPFVNYGLRLSIEWCM